MHDLCPVSDGPFYFFLLHQQQSLLPNCVLSSGSGWSFRVMKGCRLLGSCLSGVKRVTVDAVGMQTFNFK